MELLASTSDELFARARSAVGKGAGAAPVLFRQVMLEGRFEPEATTLGRRAIDAWRAFTELRLPDVVERVADPAGRPTPVASPATVETAAPLEKAVLRYADGRCAETVHLPMGRGRSAQCLSSQVGCARACAFCETGRMGLLRNLTAGEIVAQVVVGRAQLGWNPRTLVFQGMGEPLDNLDALLQSLAVLTDRRGFAWAHDRITVCTVGSVPGIARLRELGWKRLGLALSLHAGDDSLRAALMPGVRRWPLAQIQRALMVYRQRANLCLGIHYCLLPGINDRPEDARAVARFCAPLGRVMVHLIPYNPGRSPLAPAPTESDVVRFVARLRAEGLPVRRRMVKGRAAMAACGLLGADQSR